MNEITFLPSKEYLKIFGSQHQKPSVDGFSQVLNKKGQGKLPFKQKFPHILIYFDRIQYIWIPSHFREEGRN